MKRKTIKRRTNKTRKNLFNNKNLKRRYTIYKKNRKNIKNKLTKKTKSLIKIAKLYPFITAETIGSYILQNPKLKRKKEKICKKMKKFNIKC